MGTLDKRLKSRQSALIKETKSGYESILQDGLPAYSADGRIKRKHAGLKNGLFIFAGIIAVCIAVVYVSPLFVRVSIEPNAFIIEPDAMLLNGLTDYEKNHSSEDTDADGMTNAQEMQYGTLARNPDTDGDGVCDYAEIFVNGTDPLKSDDGLLKAVALADEAAGADINSPYKIHDVVMWPDDMKSRVYGGVAPFRNGYRFSDYNGWAQFPDEGYAYEKTGSGYSPLEYRESENAWHINGTCDVEIFTKPLKERYIVTLAGRKFAVPDGLGRVLTKVLPEKGVLYSAKELSGDIKAAADKSATISVMDYSDGDSMYGASGNRLDDLIGVYSEINAGRCVMASVYSPGKGAVILEAYGYDSEGNILMADPVTQTPAGKICIIPVAGRFMTYDGGIIQREWFELRGMGFDSTTNGDWICWFAFSEPSQEPEYVPLTYEVETTTAEPEPETVTTAPAEPETEPLAPEPETAAPMSLRVRVSFDGNGAESSSFETQTFKSSIRMQSFEGNISRTGWVMKGWSENPEAQEPQYSVNQQVDGTWVEQMNREHSGKLVLYAVWERDPAYNEPSAQDNYAQPYEDYSWQQNVDNGYGEYGTTAGWEE